MDDKIRRSLGEEKKWLAGITTFDHTVFPALLLAEWLKKKYGLEGLILGGDYWDFENACTATESLSWLDGIVVGYGEKKSRRGTRAYNKRGALHT